MKIYRLSNVVDTVHRLCRQEATWSGPIMVPILKHLLDVQVLGRSLDLATGDLVTILRSTLHHSELHIPDVVCDLNISIMNDLSGGLDPSQHYSYKLHTVSGIDDDTYHVAIIPVKEGECVESTRRQYAAEVKLALGMYMDFTMLEDPVDAFRELYPDLRIRR